MKFKDVLPVILHAVRAAGRCIHSISRTLFITRHFCSLPVDTAVHRGGSGVLMGMEILLLVQLLQLSVPLLHLRCGLLLLLRRRRWGRPGRLETGAGRLGGRRGGRGAGDRCGRRAVSSRRRRRCRRRALFDVVVLAQDAIVVQVEPISDTEPDGRTRRLLIYHKEVSK